MPKAVSRGRPKGKPGAASGRREGRRQAIAAGVVAGRPIAEIARTQGVSRSWASREANAPQTKLLIAELLDARRGQVEKLVDQALKAMGDAFGAKELGQPDHRVRLLAVKRVLELAAAGRRGDGDEGVQQRGEITWEMFVRLRERVVGAAGADRG